ncbi:MAG: hypothetical protein CMC59_07690 [Flavobacteriaceae bacterium]|nr:hypothetical protein [Flavobacteriaceae bacterium]|tara:strand:- start:502 stop:1257 length:756 start_codon:yes stop_codon:yes gene_type:complete
MATPNSKTTLIDYCKRRLGAPVIEINIDEEQAEDRVDEALEYYQEFHSDATVKGYMKHQVTGTDVSNEYISVSSDIIQVTKMFPITSNFNTARNFFDIKYQMMLNDLADFATFSGDVAYYEQIQQYLRLLEMKLNGHPIVNFVRRQNRLYIHGDFADNDIKAGDFIVAEVYTIINPTTHTSVFNDMWLKEYTTALIKQQWGSNLIKFEGMQLPGGVQLNGRQIYDDATNEIVALRERIRVEHELPPDFFVG